MPGRGLFRWRGAPGAGVRGGGAGSVEKTGWGQVGGPGWMRAFKTRVEILLTRDWVPKSEGEEVGKFTMHNSMSK